MRYSHYRPRRQLALGNPNSESELIELDRQMLPLLLLVSEGWKVRARWESEADFQKAYVFIGKFQRELLMGAADRLVLEVRALRGGDPLPAAAKDPKADPFALALSTLSSEGIAVRAKIEEARALLEEIRNNLAGGDVDLEDIEASIQAILLLLA